MMLIVGFVVLNYHEAKYDNTSVEQNETVIFNTVFSTYYNSISLQNIVYNYALHSYTLYIAVGKEVNCPFVAGL